MDEQLKQILFNYFSGTYSASEEAALLAWLEENEENLKTFSDMQDWWVTAHVPVFMSDMKEDFESHFGNLREDRQPEVKPGKFLTFSLKIAASLLLLISIGSFSYWLGKKAGQPEMLVRSYEAHVPYGSQSQVVLPDESIVWINAGTTLIYRENPITNSREISLNGEAYFEISTDSLRPMIINSESILVQVMGTSFNIKAYQDEDRIDITLVTGKINVLLDDSQPDSKIELTPNNMLSLQ
ncbi:MAG: FecR family protein [Tannerellaceae bacterium]|nr:FecR family protein [Tannerellaceae bacterium]